jgi:teichoic acid transport system permease protein
MTADVTQPNAETEAARDHERVFGGARHVYEPHRVGLPPLLPYFRELWRRREFALELSRTDLRSQHYNTAFGQLWLVLNPLLLAAVYFVLVDILRSGKQGAGFFAHLLAGIFAYYFFSGAVRHAAKSVTSGGRLILNTAFPRLLLPLSSVITAFWRFVPTTIIYIPAHLISGLPVNLATLWIIPITALLVLLTAGLSIFVAAVQVYFRDLKNFLPYVLRVWLYASPVLYYASQVPHGWKWMLWANPLAPILTGWSDVLHAGHAPSSSAMLVGSAWAVGIFVLGTLFFMSREREFAVRL